MTAVTTSLLALGIVASVGCGALPAVGPQRGLYIDLRKSVELSEDTGGWVIDRVEIESQASPALRSVCQVDPVERERLEAWLTAQITLAGGAAKEIYERNNGNLSKAQESLTLERVRALLRYAEARAETECPFWMHADPGFPGIEGDSHRFVLLLESLGGGSLVVQGKEVALGGGGGGRVFAAYGVGSRISLGVGAELGGNGAFVKNDQGSRTITTTFTGAIPFLFHINDFARIYDLELGPIWRLDTTHTDWVPGIRTAISVGLSTGRGQTFMPYVLLWLGYQFDPRHDGFEVSHSILIGTRVGVDMDP